MNPIHIHFEGRGVLRHALPASILFASLVPTIAGARLAGRRATRTLQVPLAEHVMGDPLVARAHFNRVVGHAF